MFTRVASDREGPDSITGDLLYFVLEQVVHQKKEVKKEENFRREWVDTVELGDSRPSVISLLSGVHCVHRPIP